MNLNKFHVFFILIGLLIVTSVKAKDAFAKGFFVQDIKVNIEVVNESGIPLPFVTILHGRSSYYLDDYDYYKNLNFEDMERVVLNYKQSSEYINTYNLPIAGLFYMPKMTNKNGQSKDIVKYKNVPNERVENIDLTYCFIKKGYHTKIESHTVHRSENEVKIKVILQKEKLSDNQNLSLPLNERFSELRYDISNFKFDYKKEKESEFKLAIIKEKFKILFEQAKSDGINDLAASILAYMYRMPEITVNETESGYLISEFSHSNPDSEINTKNIKEAYILNNEDVYIVQEVLDLNFRNLSDIYDGHDKQNNRLKLIKEYEAAYSKFGYRLWPSSINRLRVLYVEEGYYSKNYELLLKAKNLLMEMEKNEPKFTNYKNIFEVFYSLVKLETGIDLERKEGSSVE